MPNRSVSKPAVGSALQLTSTSLATVALLAFIGCSPRGTYSSPIVQISSGGNTTEAPKVEISTSLDSRESDNYWARSKELEMPELEALERPGNSFRYEISGEDITMAMESGTVESAPAMDEEQLAKMLSNPIANLYSVPIQADYNQNIGLNDDGSQWRINIQPVIPISINEEWNLISRTILPVIDQKDVSMPGMSESGLGDTVQSFFFSPQEPASNGVIWGVGPVFLLPTATDDALGGEKWGVGPTGVVLKQTGPWTYGMLANHIESVSGNNNRGDISSTLLQPFLTYRTKTNTTFVLENQTTYDWNNEEWAVPITFSVQQMIKLGKLPLQVSAGIRYWPVSTDLGPEGLGARLQLTFLFPRGR